MPNHCWFWSFTGITGDKKNVDYCLTILKALAEWENRKAGLSETEVCFSFNTIYCFRFSINCWLAL